MSDVEGLLGEVAVKAGNTSHLLNLFETFCKRLQLVLDLGGGDLIDLVQIAHSTLDDFYQDQGLNDGVASRTDSQVLHIGLG